MVQYLKAADVDGAVVVTTPQEVALLDVRKELNFASKVCIPLNVLPRAAVLQRGLLTCCVRGRAQSWQGLQGT